jgi:hypothetical protein
VWKGDKGVRSLGDAAEAGRKVAKREGTCSKASHASSGFVSCLGFNLDAEKLTHFHMDGAEFGHSVLQYDSSW